MGQYYGKVIPLGNRSLADAFLAMNDARNYAWEHERDNDPTSWVDYKEWEDVWYARCAEFANELGISSLAYCNVRYDIDGHRQEHSNT